MKNRNAPSKVWVSVFAVWGILLSGVLASFVGSPGVIQAFGLNSLLQSKQEQVESLTHDIKRLQLEAIQLDKNKVVQQREIRRVLGYAAQDEIIFDFTPVERL